MSSNTREHTLAGLFPQTSYTISVFGANAQGNGPNRSITVQTVGRPMGENSKTLLTQSVQ